MVAAFNSAADAAAEWFEVGRYQADTKVKPAAGCSDPKAPSLEKFFDHPGILRSKTLPASWAPGSSKKITPWMIHLEQLKVIRRTCVKVKNTFIECELGDEDNQFLPTLTSARSCPALVFCSLSDQESSPVSTPRCGSSGSTSTEEELPDCRTGLSMVPVPQGLRSRDFCEDEEAIPAPKWHDDALPAEKKVTPLETRKPETSLGSPQHATGDCRPCAWFWRPQGCANGSDCRHCHLCPAGAIKARRKMKVEAIRATGRNTRSHRQKPGQK